MLQQSSSIACHPGSILVGVHSVLREPLVLFLHPGIQAVDRERVSIDDLVNGLRSDAMSWAVLATASPAASVAQAGFGLFRSDLGRRLVRPAMKCTPEI